jgi:hypothetical protein
MSTFVLLHRCTYVELNKPGCVIFEFFDKLLRICEFSVDLKKTTKDRHIVTGLLNF